MIKEERTVSIKEKTMGWGCSKMNNKFREGRGPGQTLAIGGLRKPMGRKYSECREVAQRRQERHTGTSSYGLSEP